MSNNYINSRINLVNFYIGKYRHSRYDVNSYAVQTKLEPAGKYSSYKVESAELFISTHALMFQNKLLNLVFV